MTPIDIHSKKQTQMLAITPQIQKVVTESGVSNGVCHIYIPHTTAGVAINENADPMVVHDVLHVLNGLIPFTDPAYRHMEDNSAAHVKAIITGNSATVFVADGRLVLGTWEGIFFCEYDGPRHRKALIKVVAD